MELVFRFVEVSDSPLAELQTAFVLRLDGWSNSLALHDFHPRRAEGCVGIRPVSLGVAYVCAIKGGADPLARRQWGVQNEVVEL